MTQVEKRAMRKAIVLAEEVNRYLRSNISWEIKLKELFEKYEIKARDNSLSNYLTYRVTLCKSYEITESDERELARLEPMLIEPGIIEFKPSKKLTQEEIEFDSKIVAILKEAEDAYLGNTIKEPQKPESWFKRLTSKWGV